MKLSSVNQRFIQGLSSVLPPEAVRLTEPRYLEDPRGIYQGNAGMIVAPNSVEQVVHIIRAAGQARVGVVPYGGGTGLVGGQIIADESAPVLLSLERMNKIRETYSADSVMIAEAGVVLHDIQAAALDAGRLFPLSLASEGSCQIGGNLSTNAGGVNVLRYGNARNLCLGLEAVMPDGQIWNGLKRLRKDNTGYDLRDILIGAEGTLGVITAAALRLFPLPEHTGAAMIVVKDPAAAIALLNLAHGQVGEAVSAFELIHRTGLEFLTETMPEVRQPFKDQPEWMVLIDLGLSGGLDPEKALMDIFELALANDLASDGVVAQNEGQRKELWALRESIPLANKRIGSIASHDIALPINLIPEFIKKGSEVISKAGIFRINCFGHVGDGNLHYNVFPPNGRSKSDFPDMPPVIRRIVHDLVAEFDGSFSAEHGVGRLKVEDLEHYGDPAKLSAMRAIKSALDPLGIMNPGAVLRCQN